jgi:hypothetical protein
MMRSPTWYCPLAVLVILLHSVATPASGQAAQALPGTIRGVVVDARDGTPLEKVSVRVQDTKQTVITGSDGRFELTDVPAGTRELYVSSVDFILIRRIVQVTAGDILEITIPISAGTGTYSETISVSAAGGQGEDTGTIQVLRSTELQQLRGLVTNDPMRAIHVLPGVATGDDLRSEFSVRGLSVANMNFTFEGVSTPLLVHTVHGVQDSGSIAMVNGDVLQEIALAAGSYPQRYGDHTGAELNFLMREGSRDRVRGHVGTSVTDTSLVVEGPLGPSKNGSWLVSARKSYLGAIIRKLDPENDFGFGFIDVQSKLVYDVSSKHQVQFAITAGRSRLEQQPENLGIDDVKDGVNDVGVAVLTWRYVASPRFMVTQKIAADGNTFHNANRDGTELHHGRQNDLVYRTDWSYMKSAGLLVEGGGEIRRSTASRFIQGLELLRPRFQVYEDYRESATSVSSYVLTRITKGLASIAPGLRVDHSTLSGHSSASPWLDARWPFTASLNVRVGGGIYRQEPEIAEVKGLRGSDLRASRAYHLDAGIEGPFRHSTRWQVSAYNREDRDYLRLPDSEFRVADGRLVLPSFTSHYANRLDGHSRGIELLIQRRSPNGLSGWIAYNLAASRYRDRLTGEEFYGDYDQRHTLNAYGVYRFSDRMSFSSRFRAGSNFPAPGYFERREVNRHFLGIERNKVRVPLYTRLDVRANRTFTWQTKRLTLFVEALNLYGRDNVRVASPGINGNTYEVFGLFDSMFPRIPSAGLLLEF